MQKSAKVEKQIFGDLLFYIIWKGFIFTFLKVIEELLKEESKSSSNNKLSANKSDLQFSQGFTLFSTPKSVAKLNKQAVVTNCAFCIDDSNFVVCSLSSASDSEKENDQKNSSLFVVWNITEPTSPYRVLNCEGVSNCLSYFSFIVISGNVSIVLL